MSDGHAAQGQHTRRNKMPRGLDQQGRYPQAAEACTEVGNDDPEWNWVAIWVYVATVAAIVVTLLVGV